MPRRITRRRTRRKRKGGNTPFQIIYGTKQVNGRELTKEAASMEPNVILPNQSGTLIMWDPDAKNGYLHWMVHLTNGQIDEVFIPYQGPTPPSGTHRYFF